MNAAHLHARSAGTDPARRGLSGLRSLHARIAALAIAISVAAALVAAFAPDYVYALRDALFIRSLPQADALTLQRLIADYGKCSPQVAEFKAAFNAERWALNYNLALAVLIGLSATAGAIVAMRFAAAIVAPIARLSEAAKSIAAGSRDVALLPDPGGAAEIAALVDNFGAMTEALKSADNDLRLRSSGIAHELRTPLAVLRGRLVGVQDGLFAPNAELVESLLRQIGLIERLTNDLSLLCDTRGMGFALARAPTAVADLIDAVVDCLAPIAAQAAMRIEVRGTDGADAPAGESAMAGVTVPGADKIIADVDAERLERAMSNLIENAIHHGGGQRVLVSLEDLGHAVRIVVEDDGTGWKVADPESLTRPFATGEFNPAARPSRTGLGLAIVEAIVHAHHGTLTLDASPLGGARAALRIPKSVQAR